ncbi:hypothetical protein [Paenirhodobacter populi]|uniref:Uncharacterized protein n=1 Tax=Paenirhodobacter populi TaxID=2306993 RepID=A0A443J573_9RHOB|nr:hypothetical protein [Sinirhodobacter populi]RWR15466.1 hypothetical protein D2T33_00915 [Sinirhodobacter populi]
MATGIRPYPATLHGVENHAGPIPMDIRRDAMAGFCEIASTVIDAAHRRGRPAVTTVGRVAGADNGDSLEGGLSRDAPHTDPVRSKDGDSHARRILFDPRYR